MGLVSETEDPDIDLDNAALAVLPKSLESPARLSKIDMSIDAFEMVKLVGRGSFGKVVLVRFRDDPDQIFAMKIMKKRMILERKTEVYIMTEKVLQAGAAHPFIVRLHYAFQDSRRLYLVMDFVNGGELFTYLKALFAFPEDRARLYIAEIFLAVSYLHSKAIVHRDLKPENILMDSAGHLRLTDFGLATVLTTGGETPDDSLVGTVNFFSPEAVLGDMPCGIAVDYWAMGCLLYQMMIGISPFHDPTPHGVMRNIVDQEVVFPSGFDSENAMDLIRKLLKKDPSERLADPVQFRKHPFFEGLDFEKVLRKEITPPFVPTLEGPMDTRYIDEEFLKQSPDSPYCDSPEESEEMKKRMMIAFSGFEFSPRSPEEPGRRKPPRRKREPRGRRRDKQRPKPRKRSFLGLSSLSGQDAFKEILATRRRECSTDLAALGESLEVERRRAEDDPGDRDELFGIPHYPWSTKTASHWWDSVLCPSHALGIRVVVLTYFPVKELLNETYRSEYVSNQVELMKNIRSDGVNFDLEDEIEEKSVAEAYTALVDSTNKALKTALPHSQTTVDVAWSPDCIDLRCFDYAGLARVSDFVFVMAYDMRSQVITGPCIASANDALPDLERGVREYLKIAPSEKLVLGSPWYGYDYGCLPPTSTETCPIPFRPFRGVKCSDAAGFEIGYGVVIDLILHNMTDKHVLWSEELKCPYFNYVDMKSKQHHQVWFDDPESLVMRYSFAKEVNLRGIGMWNAGLLDYKDVERTKVMWDAMKIFL